MCKEPVLTVVFQQFLFSQLQAHLKNSWQCPYLILNKHFYNDVTVTDQHCQHQLMALIFSRSFRWLITGGHGSNGLNIHTIVSNFSTFVSMLFTCNKASFFPLSQSFNHIQASNFDVIRHFRFKLTSGNPASLQTPEFFHLR